MFPARPLEPWPDTLSLKASRQQVYTCIQLLKAPVKIIWILMGPGPINITECHWPTRKHSSNT